MAPQPSITNPDPDKQAYDDSVSPPPSAWSYVTDWTEEGLYVNVWTPAPDTTRRPVMVWIHGGGFVFGQASRPRENGRLLSVEHDVVVVIAPSHRLGGTGYLDTRDVPGIHGDANVGLSDLVLALEWVRDNAAAFGGDPDNVTVFGESGGAMKVHALFAIPRARGLFHKAIAQSGLPARVAGRRHRRRAQPGRQGATALATWNGGPRRLASRGSRGADDDAVARWRVLEPALDGEVLPVPVADATWQGACPDVPLLLGTDADEMRVLGVWMPLPDPEDLDGLADHVGQQSDGRARRRRRRGGVSEYGVVRVPDRAAGRGTGARCSGAGLPLRGALAGPGAARRRRGSRSRDLARLRQPRPCRSCARLPVSAWSCIPHAARLGHLRPPPARRRWMASRGPPTTSSDGRRTSGPSPQGRERPRRRREVPGSGRRGEHHFREQRRYPHSSGSTCRASPTP